MDKLVSTSAHHGCINYENQLKPTLELFSRHPEIGLVEIDFVYHEGKFISSHDYEKDNIIMGSTLKKWVKHIIRLDKIMWVDIKDTTLSIISYQFSEFDVYEFYRQLEELEIMFPTIRKHLLLSCQYTNTYEDLVKLNPGFTIINDMPQDQSYVLDKFMPLSLIKTFVHDTTLSQLKGIKNIICLDKSFFMNGTELSQFIRQLDSDIVILYSYEIGETDLPVVEGKHIIYQYNYKY